MRRPDPARVMQVLTVAVFLVAAALAIRLVGQATGGGDEYNIAESTSEAYSVTEALAVNRDEPLAIRGWVFDGPFEEWGLRLCVGRDDEGDDPRCVGPFLSLKGQVNQGSFELRQVDTEHGPMGYSPRPVVVQGLLRGTELIVELVLEQ